MKKNKKKRKFQAGDFVVINHNAGTRVKWKGVITGSVDGFLRVHLSRNVIGDDVSDTVDFLPSMLDLREVSREGVELDQKDAKNTQGA